MSKREVLERALAEAERATLDELSTDKHSAYYDKQLTVTP